VATDDKDLKENDAFLAMPPAPQSSRDLSMAKKPVDVGTAKKLFNILNFPAPTHRGVSLPSMTDPNKKHFESTTVLLLRLATQKKDIYVVLAGAENLLHSDVHMLTIFVVMPTKRKTSWLCCCQAQ
jgi:hypothetical protein